MSNVSVSSTETIIKDYETKSLLQSYETFSFIVFDNGFRRGDRNVRQKYLKLLLIWKNK